MTSQTLRRARAALTVAVGTVLAAAALAVVPLSPAQAHDSLVDASPSPDSTVTQVLPMVTLTFSDDVMSLSDTGSASIVQVTDADGLHYETACAANQGRQVAAPVALGEAGTYRVTYQVVSADGHPVSDEYTFTYEPPADASPATGTNSSLCALAGDSTADQSQQQQSNADDDGQQVTQVSGDATTMLTIMIVVFVVLIAAVALSIMFVRGKNRDDDERRR